MNDEEIEIMHQLEQYNGELLQRLKGIQAANAELNKTILHLSRTQAKQFMDNQNLQVAAEKAKDVVNLDTARQIKRLKELLKGCSKMVYKYAGGFPLQDDDQEYMRKINEVLQ